MRESSIVVRPQPMDSATYTASNSIGGTGIITPTSITAFVPQGQAGYITQALGGSFTLYIDGNLFRLAGEHAEAIGQEVVKAPELPPDATLDDRVGLADAHIRTNDWDSAAAELNRIPPTHETFDRYRLEAEAQFRRLDAILKQQNDSTKEKES